MVSIRPDADLDEAGWWDTSWESGTPAAVGFLIPRGFEAYARVFHPAGRNDDAGTSVSWATVAVECGTTLHPQAQWSRVAGNLDLDPHGRPEQRRTWPGHEPDEGRLGRPQLEALAGVLAHHTTTPERTIVAFWVGYGVWPGAWFDAPTTCRPGRESFLFERPLIDVPTLCAEAPDRGRWQSPSAWWPADRAWATSNDTDLDSTLVGGSRALVDELIADDRLEVLPWPVGGSLWAGADEVNR